MEFINQLISAAHRPWIRNRSSQSAANFFRRYWEAIRDHKVAGEIRKVKVALRRLDEERDFLNDQHRAREQEIAALNIPENVARYKLREANREAFLCAVLFVAILVSGYWVTSYVSQEWRLAVLAIFLTAPIVIHFSIRTLSLTPGFKRIVNIIAVFIVLAVLTGSSFLYMAREVAIKSEAQLQDTPSSVTGEDLVRLEAEKLKHLNSNSRSFASNMSHGMLFLGLMAEIALGLMWGEAMKNRAAAMATLDPYRQLRKIKSALIRNAEASEAAKQRPGILYHDLTVAGLTQEAQEARAEETRRQEETRRRVTEERKRLLEAEQGEDIGWAIRRAVVIFVFLLLCIGLFTAGAFSAETQTIITVIDLTTSTGVDEEFKENVKAAGDVLKNTFTAGTRAVVIGIGEQSFGAPIILDRTAPFDVGRFGERLSSERLQMLKAWEDKKKMLKPTEQGSDIFGFFARASLIFKDQTNGTKRLIVLSDMRQVGRGYNFERSIADPASVLKKVQQEGLIPDLAGIQVWILGAHTAGIDERVWHRLKDFWILYNRESGSELKAFSPSREALKQIKLK